MLVFIVRRPIADIGVLRGFAIDEHAAMWQRRLGLEPGCLERDHDEDDRSYRPRLAKMISETIEFL